MGRNESFSLLVSMGFSTNQPRIFHFLQGIWQIGHAFSSVISSRGYQRSETWTVNPGEFVVMEFVAIPTSGVPKNNRQVDPDTVPTHLLPIRPPERPPVPEAWPKMARG